MKKRRNLLLCSLAAVLLLWAAIAVTGCGSKSAGTAAVMAAAGAAETETANSYNAAGSGITDTSGLSQSVKDNRKLIRDVGMNVETTDFDTVVSQITSKVSELGGYVESSNISGISFGAYGSSGQRYADITARIPADKLDGFIGTVQAAGNVTNKTEQVSDVTLQYSDMESRQKSLKIEQDRLWALLEKADTLEAVIALESRLSEIRYQLESYESQLRLFDNQVAYSTVSLYIAEVRTLMPAAPDGMGTRIQKGFQRSVSQLKDTGVSIVVWTASNSPVLLLWAVVICIAVFLIRKFRKKTDSSTKSKKHSFYNHSDYEKENEKTDDK